MLPDMVESGKPTTSEEQPQEQPQREGKEGSKEEPKKEDVGASEQEETGDLSSKLEELELSIKENQEERKGLAGYNNSLLKEKTQEQREIIIKEFQKEDDRLIEKRDRLKGEQQKLKEKIAEGEKEKEKKPVEENGGMMERFSKQRREIVDRFIDMYYGPLPPSRDPKKAAEAISQHIKKRTFFKPTDEEKRKYGGPQFSEKALENVTDGWIRSTAEETIKILQDLGKVDR